MKSNNPITRKRQRKARKMRAKREHLREIQRSTRRGRTCESKNAFASEADALAVMCSAQKHGLALCSYQCPYCGNYHLTSATFQQENQCV